MTQITEALQDFLSSKTSASLDQLSKSTELEDESMISKTLTKSSFFDFFETSFQGLDQELQCKLLTYVISLKGETILNQFSDNSIIILTESAKTPESDISQLCLDTVCRILCEKKSINSSLEKGFESNLPTFFNRKVHLNCVASATEIMVELVRLLPLEQLVWIDGPMVYALQHVSSRILESAFKAAINYTAKGCLAITQFIQSKYLEMMYTQLRFPNVDMKKSIFKVFTNIAACCPEHRHFVLDHDVRERIPVFLCHYDDNVCMQCIELLDALQQSVQQMIDRKYVISLVLHVSMSNIDFKLRCFDMLRNMFNSANEKQVQNLIEFGFIRPFCSMMADCGDEKCKEIIELLLRLVQDHHGLDAKLCRFDFDHAHHSNNTSCVNQIMAVRTRQDGHLSQMANKLLDYLSARDIVNHVEQPEEN